MKSINELVQEAHTNAVNKGWWDEDRGFGAVIALIHSEVSEALEDYRNGEKPTTVWYEHKDAVHGTYRSSFMRESKKDMEGGHISLGKPCGIPSEFADIVIRVFDACGRYGIDLEQAIKEKMEYNATRPQRHGGKTL